MSTHKQSLDPNQQANRWESAQSSSLATPDTAHPTDQAQPIPSSNGPTPTPPETPEPHRGKSPFRWLKQRWQNSSFRTKLLLVLMVAAALPAIASTQGSVIVAQRRALADLEAHLRRDLQLIDQELRQQENEHEAQARRIATGVIASGIDLNNSEAAEARSQLQNLLQAAVQDQPNRSFYIITDAQGRTVAQYVQLLKIEVEPLLPTSNTMLEQEFEPITLPTGISLADVPIVESALQGRPLAGFELLNSEPLARLGLAEQANIGLRAFETQALDESKQPSPEGTYDIDGGRAGLLVMAVEPIERQGTVIGTAIVGTLLNRNYEIVDRLKEEAEVATATIFARDWKVSTNVPYSDGTTRAIGTRVSREVAQQVLEQGENFFGFDSVVGVNYLTGYSPLYSHQQDLNPNQAQPIGIAYVGEPQTAVQATLRGITLTGYSIGGLAVLAASAAAVAVAGTFSQPLRRLSQFAERVGAGEKGIRLADTDREDEIGILSQEVQRMVTRLEAKAEQDQVMAAIASARQTQELEASLNNFLALVGSTLNADRVFLYRLDADGGSVLGESVRPGWTSVLGQKLDNIWTPEGETDDQRSWMVPIPNVAEAGFERDRLLVLQQLQVRSSLSVSVFLNQELYGVLVVHHCAQTRDWQQSEIDYLAQGAQQLSVALSAYSLFEQQQAEAERQRQQKEALQQELLQLLSEIEGASQGNLTVRAEMSAGEIGVVADFFNVIIESLREIVVQVKQAAAQVNTSVGENEGAIRALAEEAIAQAAQIDQTLDSVENMTRSIQEVADNARQAATVAQAASETAQSGGEAMDRVVQSILQLRETVAETAKKVKRLGESSQQISKVVSLINEIAMKTNLLAVNASIEAARAGEEGRGFAVVAEEVGELATQSTTATREIEQIVASIQRETSEVVRAMEVGTTQVVEGTQLVEETKQSLAQIVEVSQQIAQLVQFISNATVSQAQTSQSVAQLMEEIAQVSKRTSDSSRQVSSLLQATVEIAQQLQATVSTFTVEAEE